MYIHEINKKIRVQQLLSTFITSFQLSWLVVVLFIAQQTVRLWSNLPPIEKKKSYTFYITALSGNVVTYL